MNNQTASVSTKDLKPILTIAERMTRRFCKPHAQNVQISLNGAARISWSNIEFNIQASIDCEHSGEDFSVTVPAGDLLQVLRGTKSKRLEIIPGDGSTDIPQTEFHSGSIVRRISPNVQLESVTDVRGETTVTTTVPDVPAINFTGETVYVDSGDFVRGVKGVLHAVDPESSRYALGGILLKFDLDSLQLVATDSRRLAVRQIVASGSTFAGTFNVPASAAETFLKLLPKKLIGDIALTIDQERGRIILQYQETAIESPEVQGRFPRWEDVVPRSNLSSAIIRREELRDLMDEFRKMQNDENRGIDLKFAADLLTIRGTGENRQSGASLPILCPGRVNFTIDPRFVLEALDALESPEIVWEWINGETAMVIRSPIPGIHTEVIMPLSRDR